MYKINKEDGGGGGGGAAAAVAYLLRRFLMTRCSHAGDVCSDLTQGNAG